MSFYYYHPQGRLIVLNKLVEEWFEKKDKMTSEDYFDICNFVTKLFNLRHEEEFDKMMKWEEFLRWKND